MAAEGEGCRSGEWSSGQERRGLGNLLRGKTEHKWSLEYSIQSPSMNLYAPQPCFIHREAGADLAA
uniref:Uncharacterized protein n=1 Tax=Oryza punctata TaxID=4537 RepID=A0A0E0M2I3_ORYPU